MIIAVGERRHIRRETRALAQISRRRLWDPVNSVGVLCAFRGTTAASFDDDSGHYRRTHFSGVHSRHTRTIREPKGLSINLVSL